MYESKWRTIITASGGVLLLHFQTRVHHRWLRSKIEAKFRNFWSPKILEERNGRWAKCISEFLNFNIWYTYMLLPGAATRVWPGFLPSWVECNWAVVTRKVSVCLSNAWIVIKRTKDPSRFLYRTKDHLASFSEKKNGWWRSDPFYLKFWVKLTPLERNRRFSVHIRS